MGKSKNGVPDRWEAYSKIGKIVEGTPFIPFKVPLKQSLLDNVPKGVDNKWKIEDLIEAIPSPGLGLVIDLTFTTRYYDSQNFTSSEIEHKKIMTKGHEIPNSTVVEQFSTAVDQVLAKEDRKLIGVHCTHGLNRTGYLICRYMIQKLGVEPEVAIAAFDEARGHKQERQNYIHDLKTKGWEKESKDEHKNGSYGAWKAARGGGGKMPSDRYRDGIRGAYNNTSRGFTHAIVGDYESRRGRYSDWQPHSMNPGTTHYQERSRGRREHYGRGFYEGSYGGRSMPYSSDPDGGRSMPYCGDPAGGRNMPYCGDPAGGRSMPYCGDPAGYEQNYGEWRTHSGRPWGYEDNQWDSGDSRDYGRRAGSDRCYQDQGRAGPYAEGFGRREGYGGDRGRHEAGHVRGRGRTDYQR